MTQNRLREEIFTFISNISPVDVMEGEHLEFVKNWIGSGAELFRTAKPATPDTHLVSYFVILDTTTDEILLVDHKKAGRWLPPGGHVEPDEHPRDTVKREIREELGIEADFLYDDPLFLTVKRTLDHMTSHTDVSLWYVLKCDRNTSLQYDMEEFHGIRWFPTKDIPYEKAETHLKRFIAKLSLKCPCRISRGSD